MEVEYDYEAELQDELTIQSGDILTSVKQMSGGWWEGVLKGKRGLFPENFVKVRGYKLLSYHAQNFVYIMFDTGRKHVLRHLTSFRSYRC